MKKLMMIICASGFLITAACDNRGNRTERNTEGRTDTIIDDNGTEGYSDTDRAPDDKNFGADDTDRDVEEQTYRDNRGVGENDRRITETDDSETTARDTDGNPTTDKMIADENIPDDYKDDPTYDADKEPSMKELPGEAREKIQNDEAFKNLRLESSRSYSRNGKTYYEITLEEIDVEDDN